MIKWNTYTISFLAIIVLTLQCVAWCFEKIPPLSLLHGTFAKEHFALLSVETAFLWPLRISWQFWIKMSLPEPNLGNCIFFSLINSIVSIRKERFLPTQKTVSVQEDGFEMLSQWRQGFGLSSPSIPHSQIFKMADPVR